MKKRTSGATAICSLALACSGWLSGVEAAGQPGAYRPVEGQQANRGAQGQFAPVENRGNQRWSPSQALPSPTLPSVPGARPGYGGYPATGYGTYPPTGYGTYPPAGYGGYAPPGYGRPLPPPAPGNGDSRRFSVPLPNPGNVMDNFFGSRNDDRPEAYLPPPTPPLAAPVAPVYNPPVPQPAPAVPPLDTPEPPPATSAPHAQYLGQNPSSRQKERVKKAPPPASPRPFSNPQETGNAFPLRTPPKVGRSDPRFRPPELKGTP